MNFCTLLAIDHVSVFQIMRPCRDLDGVPGRRGHHAAEEDVTSLKNVAPSNVVVLGDFSQKII